MGRTEQRGTVRENYSLRRSKLASWERIHTGGCHLMGMYTRTLGQINSPTTEYRVCTRTRGPSAGGVGLFARAQVGSGCLHSVQISSR